MEESRFFLELLREQILDLFCIYDVICLYVSYRNLVSKRFSIYW